MQPLIYSLVQSNLGGGSAQATLRVKNVVSPKTIDHIVYGVVLGLVAGYIVRKVLIRGAAKTTKRTGKTATKTDIKTLLGEAEKSLEEYSNN